jgi:hypothetical protein
METIKIKKKKKKLSKPCTPGPADMHENTEQRSF